MESTYSDPAVRQAIQREIQRNTAPVTDPSADVTDLVEAGAVAIARSKYNGKPIYAEQARPTRSDTKYAAAAIEAALRLVAAQITDHADPVLIAAYLEDAAESIAREYTS